jgi:ParB family transcriptional regulator, chromosome partitioning protein
MPKPKGGLGRGLGSLIPQSPSTDISLEEASGTPAPLPVEERGEDLRTGPMGPVEVPVESISANPLQPRQNINPRELDELAASIREHGVLQPLVVTASDGRYSLIAGERRWRAAMLAGMERVPVIIKEASSRQMLELALVENLQREDLNPLEEAAAYRALVEEFGLRQDEVAARVGKSRQAVTNSLRLLRLPPVVQEALADGLILEGHARAILQVPDEDHQIKLMQRTVADDLSVRQVEELARRLAEAAAQPQKPKPPPEAPLYNEVNAWQDNLRDALGTKVHLSRSSRGGRLVIYFYSDDELKRIYETIVGEEE